MSSRGDESSPWNALNRILAATDGSASSIDAVAFAVELAVEHNSELTFVHVVPTLDVLTIDFEETPWHCHTSQPHATTRCSRTRLPWRRSPVSWPRPNSSVARRPRRSWPTRESADVDLIVVGSAWARRGCQRADRQRLARRPTKVIAPGAHRPRELNSSHPNALSSRETLNREAAPVAGGNRGRCPAREAAPEGDRAETHSRHTGCCGHLRARFASCFVRLARDPIHPPDLRGEGLVRWMGSRRTSSYPHGSGPPQAKAALFSPCSRRRSRLFDGYCGGWPGWLHVDRTCPRRSGVLDV